MQHPETISRILSNSKMELSREVTKYNYLTDEFKLLSNLFIFFGCFFFCIKNQTLFRYTADNNGYKAEVSYLDQQGHNIVSNPTASPQPVAQQPLNYYRNVQPFNHNTGGYRNPPVYNNYPSPTAPTIFIPHIDHEQVQIDTYNAGPHHQQQNVFSSSTALPAVVSTPNYVNVYPSPTPVTSSYKDIYVISSARPYIHSTPTAAVAPLANHKSTNVLSSAGYSRQFGDYDYQTDHGYRGRSVSRIWMKSGNIL